MKKRLFVLFMAAVVGFTGMPMTFANAADDVVVTTTEDEQPDACKTVSGNYGIKIDEGKTKFTNKLNSELSKKLYDILVDQLITNPWKERKNENLGFDNGVPYINIEVVNVSVPGSMQANSGKYIKDTTEDTVNVTEARDNFVAAIFNAVNVLKNTYPNELAGLDLSKLNFEGNISGDAKDTKEVIKISFNNDWAASYVDNANKVISNILEQADSFVKDNADYKDNPDIGRIVYFDQWLVNNVSTTTDTKTGMNNTQYGAFVNETANNEGYVLAMSALLDKLGLDNEIVYGTTDFDAQYYGYWNIVKIKDSFYIIDSYKNDKYSWGSYSSSDPADNRYRPYLLIGKEAYSFDSYYAGNGKFYTNKFIDDKIVSMEYSTISEKNYFVNHEFDDAVVLAKKKSGNVFTKEKLKDYNIAKATYTSSDSNIVSVSKKGKLKAKAPGKATITVQKAGSEAKETVDVYVYEVESLIFDNGTNKASTACKLHDSFYVAAQVKFTTNTKLNARQVQTVYNKINKKQLKVAATSNKKKAVQVGDVVTLGDYVITKVNVTSEKKCKAKVTIAYGNKKAKYSIEVGNATASN